MYQYQFYWPNWWKLWPSYHAYEDDYNGHRYRSHIFVLGAFQINWISK